MSILIPGMEMPKEGNETILRLMPDGTVLDQYGHHLALKAVPVPEHGEWIPVTERLPEAGKRVLCYCRANIYEVMKMRTDGDWVHNDQVYDSTYMGRFVTHWMPLPEPPKGEQNG